VPQYVPDAARRVRELVAEWWADAQNRSDLARIAIEALLMLFVLSVASWRGIRRLRHWRYDEEPPYWRQASSAAGVILLRALPVAAPAVFLYIMIASAQALPERVDWLFCLITQSIVIIFTVGALVSGAIRTDLAIAILHAFAEAGIAIPSGRAKITIRNLDALREMIAQNATLPPGKSGQRRQKIIQRRRRREYRCSVK
jgi:small-conductance mechanosensitive channel